MTFTHIDPGIIRASAAAGDDIYPHAEYRPIPEAETQRTIEPWSFILHTMAGPRSTDPDDLWAFVNREDIRGESHLILGYDDDRGDHDLYQVVPFTVAAHNNYKANEWLVGSERRGAISVETQDDGASNNVEDDPWTLFQLEHLAGVTAFLHLRYGIPIQRVVDGWNTQGVDGHRRYPEWSVYVGKTCPGQARWEQIDTVLSMAQTIVTPPTPVPPSVPEEDPMRLVDHLQPFLLRIDGYAEVVLITDGRALPLTTEMAELQEWSDELVEAQQNPHPNHSSLRRWVEAQIGGPLTSLGG